MANRSYFRQAVVKSETGRNGERLRVQTTHRAFPVTPCMLLAIALADQSTKLNRAFEGTPISSALKLSG